MLHFWNHRSLDRRELLRAGGIAVGGLSLSGLISRQAGAATGSRSFGKARNCILLYLSGGPAQLDTFDPKPDAPAEIRGEFSTVATKVPGVHFSEHMTRLASIADFSGSATNNPLRMPLMMRSTARCTCRRRTASSGATSSA